jgi:hypothetical protein
MLLNRSSLVGQYPQADRGRRRSASLFLILAVMEACDGTA